MTRPAVHLPDEVRRAIIAHAEREGPRECCGLLVGQGQVVSHAVAVPNRAAGVTRFRLDDRAHIDVRRTLRCFEPPLEIVGVYHSHPTGAPVPSETDIAEAHYPDWIHLIVGRAGSRPRVAAYRIQRGRADALRLSRT